MMRAGSEKGIHYVNMCIRPHNTGFSGSPKELLGSVIFTLLRLFKLESVFIVSFVAVKPTEWVVFGVLVFGALNA